jgi:hypothetical protein
MTRIREANMEDHAGVAALEKRYGLFTTSKAVWCQRWQGNPALERVSTPWPIGWIVETEAGQVAGFFGNIPMAYEINGKRMLAAVTNSWVVDEDHRSQSLKLLNRFLNQPSVDLFLSTTANSQTMAAMMAFKAHKVPQPDCDQALFWITNYPGFGRALAAKANTPFPEVIGQIAGLGFGIADVVRRRPSLLTPKIHKFDTTLVFDDRFDVLWQRLRSGPGMLRLVRDRSSLNWHFRRFLNDDDAWIVTCEKVEKNIDTLTGYAVFVRQDNAKIGLRRALLADIQVEGNDKGVIRDLVLTGLAECRARRLDLLEAIGLAATKRHVLKGITPWTRRLPNWPYLYKARTSSLAEMLRNPTFWDASPIDGDACL